MLEEKPLGLRLMDRYSWCILRRRSVYRCRAFGLLVRAERSRFLSCRPFAACASSLLDDWACAVALGSHLFFWRLGRLASGANSAGGLRFWVPFFVMVAVVTTQGDEDNCSSWSPVSSGSS